MEKSRLLEVDEYSLEELHVSESGEGRRSDGERLPLPDVDFRVFTHSTAPEKFAVSLSVGGRNGRLKFSLRIIGYFTVAEPFENSKVPAERVVNALSILYGVVRGYVGTCAAWFDDSIVIPTVYFTDLVNAKIEAERQHAVEESEERLIESARTA
jgi:hypothetical protein